MSDDLTGLKHDSEFEKRTGTFYGIERFKAPDLSICGIKVQQFDLIAEDVILMHPKTFQLLKEAMDQRVFTGETVVITSKPHE